MPFNFAFSLHHSKKEAEMSSSIFLPKEQKTNIEIWYISLCEFKSFADYHFPLKLIKGVSMILFDDIILQWYWQLFSSEYVEVYTESRTESLSKVFFPSLVVCNVNPLRKSFMYDVLKVLLIYNIIRGSLPKKALVFHSWNSRQFSRWMKTGFLGELLLYWIRLHLECSLRIFLRIQMLHNFGIQFLMNLLEAFLKMDLRDLQTLRGI